MITKSFSKFHGSRLAAAALASVAFAGFAAITRADTVNIQFEGVATVSSADSFSGQKGVYTSDNVASPVWNVLAGGQGTQSSLVDSSGNTTTDAVSYIGNATSGPDYNFQTNPANELLSGFLQDSTPAAVTLTGLVNNGSYQLYLYGQPGQFASWYDSHHRGAAFSITTGTGGPVSGSAAYTLQYNSGTQNVFQENTNYVVFNATASSSGTLAITWTNTPAEVTPIGSNGQDGSFNGLQLVSSAPVPEPLTLGLFGVGGLGLLLLKRRRMT
ncbi:MAG: PEP-CTERM sorting domain-containing protein [Planctomycetia bacterium]|nr:PEP-CTERM sorting domain-containing protein [Planctomycetia bacterium]